MSDQGMGAMPKLVPARVLHAAQDRPEKGALGFGVGELSYAALAEQSYRLSRGLIAAGLAKGDLVGVCLPRTPARLALILAVWRAGGVALMLDPEWPERRLTQIVANSGCGLVAVMEDLRDRDWGPASSFQVDAKIEAAAPDPQVSADAPIGPDDLAYVIYTSGSTGEPKGVEITHGNLSALVAWHLTEFEVTANDRATHLAGLGFDAAIWEVWPYLAAGASVSLAPECVRTSAAALRDWLVKQRITIAFAPTLLAEELVRLPWPNTPLRRLLTGGDRLRIGPPRDLPFALVNNYGPSECTVVATSGVVPPGDEGAPAIGTPIAGTIVRILDDADRPVTAGLVGEICIGGAGVGRGYRNDPAATAAAFVPDPASAAPGARLYRTGDLGRWREDGMIVFEGRKDDQLKVRGYRIEPDEVAAMLLQHPAVHAAAVAGMEGEHGPALAAYIVARPGDAPTGDALHGFLAERLPDWSIPSAFVGVPALPVTPNGKLDRAALPRPSAENVLASRPAAAPTSPTEARLLAILSDVLGEREVGIDDNFFLLGGHSLLGTQVVLRAGAAFGVDLTLRHLFHAPTVRELAAAIEALVDEAIAAMDDDELLRAHG